MRPAPAWGWAAATAAVCGYWVAVAMAAGDGSAVTTDAGGAAAAAATAALAGAGWRPASARAAACSGAVLVGVPVAVASAGAGHPRPLAGALALAGLAALAAFLRTASAGRGDSGKPDVRQAEVSLPGTPAATPEPGTCWATRRRDSRPLLAGPEGLAPLSAAGGCAVATAALLVQRVDSARWVLAGGSGAALVLALCGAALLLVAATVGPSRAAVLGVPAAVLGVAAAGHLPEPSGVVAAGAAAAALAWVAASRPTLSLFALALAAGAFGPTIPAGRLFAAGAVLALVAPRPWAALLGVPGAAALAVTLVPAPPTASGLALAATAGATAVLLARPNRCTPPATPHDRPGVDAVPGLLLVAWLVLAPGTWGWVGPADLAPYDRGAATAAATAGLAAVTGRLVGERRALAGSASGLRTRNPRKPLPAWTEPTPSRDDAPAPARARRRRGPPG